MKNGINRSVINPKDELSVIQLRYTYILEDISGMLRVKMNQDK